MTATARDDSEYECRRCCNRNVPMRSHRRQRQSNAGSDVRKYIEGFGKALNEDVRIGVIFALAPSSVRHHCHLNSHMQKTYAQVRTMLCYNCQAQADVAASENVL